MRNWVFFTILIGLSFSQIVYHQPVHTARAGTDLQIEAIIDDSGYGIDQVLLFFRTFNQFDYIHLEMDHLYGEIYSGIIPHNFLNSDIIEYYIVAEVGHGGIISYPLYTPSENPLRTRLDYNFILKEKPKKSQYKKETQKYKSEIISGEESGALILSPEPNDFIQLDDVMIAISLMAVEDIDFQSITAEINGRDVSNILSVNGEMSPNPLISDGSVNISLRSFQWISDNCSFTCSM